ncbi:hypothetical protein PHYPSEUDO_011539 [Phytophthora pseudosyringae]|uniref:Uncharacterized protein n=1 Tax=Phytophthora pseudosyringae TaxID=221518 RepID=A0A8T1VBP2_9STRA|nr:hypothetical protein PHYPSEUDO_011539 [Phytophthora pseudosyringae]
MHENNAPRIERLGAGATLVSAKCRERLEAFEAVGGGDEVGSKPRLIVTNLPDGGNALLPPFDPSEEGKTRDPILAVQHTRFACGGVAIGICLRHIICDASGFFQLVRDLAALYRGFRDLDEGKLADKNSVKLSKPPHIHSYRADLHEMTPEKRQEALESQPAGFRLSGKSATASALITSNNLGTLNFTNTIVECLRLGPSFAGYLLVACVVTGVLNAMRLLASARPVPSLQCVKLRPLRKSNTPNGR